VKDGLLSKLRMPDGSINPWVIAVTVTLATFMEVLDTSIANVALPHISGNLSAGADESTWVLTSYLVSNAIVLPLSGWLSSLIGRKRFYMTSVALFTASSFLCGLAPSLGVLVFFRILQGVGGAVIMLMMPVVGLLVSRVDTKYLIAFGCTVSALALFVMSGWNLGIDYGHAVRARMLQSFGLAFLFIPINVSAFAFVPKEKTNMGTGIINLARNVGASVGIATVTTLLERRTQFHQAQLMEHINALSATFHGRLHAVATSFLGGGSSGPGAVSQAYGMIYGSVERQAAMLAFVDNFYMLGVVFLMVIPVLLLLRRPPKGTDAPVH